MRHLAAGTSLLLVTLIGAAARAEPAVDQPAQTSAAAGERPRSYVATGGIVGGVDEHFAAGLSADAGMRIYEGLWLHAGGATVADGELFAGSGSLQAVHVGAELSSCHRGEHVCAFAGADVGYAQSEYTEYSWFGDESMTTSAAGTVGVVRAGLDIGNKHLRWRPGFEGMYGAVKAGGLTSSLVLQF